MKRSRQHQRITTPENRRPTRAALGLFCFVALAAAAGWALLIEAGRTLPVREAMVQKLYLRLVEARWIVDQMDHGENFQKPGSMMPGMPARGSQRVTLSVSLENRSPGVKVFRGEEFLLEPEIGDAVAPVAAQVGHAVLRAGQTLNTVLHFDFDTRRPHGKLRVVWRRDGEAIYLPIPAPVEHQHLLPRGDASALPGDARLLLPIGKPERGRQLFEQVYGCIACHGDPSIPGSNNVGPHLAGLSTRAATRIEGVSALQYIYQSILEPNAFIAPECRDHQPCEQPSAMPEYGNLLSLEDVADLVTYLFEDLR